MGGIGKDCGVGSSMEGTTEKTCMMLHGEDDYGTEGWNKKAYATNSMTSFHVVDDAPTSGWDVMIVVPKSNHWRCDG